MNFFFNRKFYEESRSQYENTLKRILEVKHEIDGLTHKVEIMQTNINDLRGKFNRKLYKLTPEEEKALETPRKPQETQSLNTFNPFSI